MNRHVRGMQRQYGQGLIEFIITIAVLGPLLLGIFQAVLLYRAKTLLDYAALQAARNHRVRDCARKHLLRLHVLVEVKVDRQPILFG